MKKTVCFILILLCIFSAVSPAYAAGIVPTQKEALEWVMAQEGTKVDINGDGRNDCSDLVKAYSMYLFDYIERGTTGYHTDYNEDGTEYYTPLDVNRDFWTRFYEDMPQPGDVAFWYPGSYMTKPYDDYWVTPLGHGAIVIDVNGDTITVAEQSNGRNVAIRDFYSASTLSFFIRPHFYVPDEGDYGDTPVLIYKRSGNNITLSWNESTWAKYRLNESIGNETNWQTLKDFVPGQIMSYSTELADNNIYYFKIEALNTAGTVCESSNVIIAHNTESGKAHDLVYVEAIEATEEQTGLTAHYVCTVCGNCYYDADAQKQVSYETLVCPTLPHTHRLVYIPKYFQTTSTIGEEAHYHCNCGLNFSDPNAEGVFPRSERILFPLSAEIEFAKTKTYENQFTDVNKDKWYYKNVSEAFELALMKGNSDSVFNPKGNVSVVEAITMACRIHSIHATGTENFTQGNPWYQVYLDYALENGIISEEMYSSDVSRIATRAEFAEIFAKALPDIGLIEVNNVFDGDIPDVAASANYYDAVYKLYRAGILNGSDDKKTFYPNNNISRAEASAIVSRMASVKNRIISEN